MAVYNGEKYLVDQIDSILNQLGDSDELVISYNESSDRTLEIITAYSERDQRIRIFTNPEKGVVKNFEKAIKESRGSVIFLADQDDVWIIDKIETMLLAFSDPKVTVAIHDASLTDERLNVTHQSTFAIRNCGVGILHNLIRLSYIGCCLAFRATCKDVILPIPTRERSHDWWIGTICSVYGKMAKIDRVLIYHRMHGDNATPAKRPSIQYQISVRYIIIKNLFCRVASRSLKTS